MSTEKEVLITPEIVNELKDDSFLAYAGGSAGPYVPPQETAAPIEPSHEEPTLVNLFISFNSLVSQLDPNEAEHDRITRATLEARHHFGGLIEAGQTDHWLGFFKHAVTEGRRLQSRGIGLRPDSFSCLLERYVETHRPYQKTDVKKVNSSF